MVNAEIGPKRTKVVEEALWTEAPSGTAASAAFKASSLVATTVTLWFFFSKAALTVSMAASSATLEYFSKTGRKSA